MRFIFISKATKFSEAGVCPSKESVDAMNAFHEELAKAGVLENSEKFYPSSSGLRISYDKPGGEPKFIPGPQDEVKELAAGYTIINVNSEEEALKWAIKMPDPSGYGDGVIEFRQLFDHPVDANNLKTNLP